MIECPRCGRLFPEVVGARSQACAHCGHEFDTERVPAKAKPAVVVDPVSALAAAARVGFRRYPRLLVVFLPALALEVAVGFGIQGYSAAVGLPEDVARLTTGQQMQLLGVALPLTILLYTARLALWAYVARQVLAAMGVASGRGNILGAALLAGFVMTLTFIAGLFLVVVGFLVFFHWFVYAPAQLAAGAPSVGAAFDRSRRFAQEHRTYGFTALLLLVGVPVFGVAYVLGGLEGSAGIFAPAVVNWIGGPLVPLLAASYVAVAAASSRSAAAPQEPTAPARANAKCPRCETLIEYVPTGAPVDVVCPSCGYAGKVL